MPGYGISTGDDGMLPWESALEQLRESRHYWVATTCPDRAPHVAAVWAVWFDGALVFSTGGRSAKARNLALDPRCAITTSRADRSVVMRGRVERIMDSGTLAAISRVYVDKYGSGFPDPAENPVLAIRPGTVISVSEAEDEFTRTATRWTFAP